LITFDGSTALLPAVAVPFHFRSTGFYKMPNLFNGNLETAIAALPAAERKMLLAKLQAANSVHPEIEARIKRALNGKAPSENFDGIISAMLAEGVIRNSVVGDHLYAGAADTKQARIERLAAAASDHRTESSVKLLKGILKRAHVSLDEIIGADVARLDQIFAAASNISVTDRLTCKSIMKRLRLI
jgi:hypothetical protein